MSGVSGDIFTEMVFQPYKDPDHMVVGRLKTTMWHDSRGVHAKKSFTYLKRLSKGYNIVAEDAIAGGADETIPRIVNWDEVEDGIYRVIVINQSRDWESGHVDDYDLKLIPYEETK